ncbi:Calcineurin-like phosphoesterase [Cyclobacterium lianum]|uniref:Calcineurin-like phosphoesterase n=1 Tax=Cyclobacterium lianum TaxID=388280 RepID=A0A1M7QLA9_9BACT|nr:metallophosphoesterase family protein [Cyclobacterium lianum]SHN31901.1 Calcineurin-like phosphoesterase [Cyclobacterium lianum]
MKNLLFSLSLILAFQFSMAQEYRVYKAPTFREEWSKPSYFPDRIVLNFGEDPSSQASVTWRTDTSIEKAFAEIAVADGAPKFWRNASTIEAATEVLDATAVEVARVKAHYHSVSFKDLKPDTMYAYRVGDGDTWSEWIQFSTASREKDKPFSFLYVGDTQNYILELWSRLIREGYRKAPDAKFIIHAGDLVNVAHRETEWHEWFSAGSFIHSMVPSMVTPGNHEYRSIPELDGEDADRRLSLQWRPQFTLPENGPEGLEALKETVYYMDYQDARIISLNSNILQAEQIPWLEEVLANNPQKWTIVTYHHPLFSASEGRENTRLRDAWKPLFDKYQVDLALQGHDHSYARGRVSPEENVMDGVNTKDQTGTVYVVSVSGGKMYGLRKNAWNDYEAERDRAAENTQLFQVINIEGDKLSFESYTAVGDLYDAFDLEKQEDGTNKFIERKSEAGEERRFSNTISYEDPLPENLETILLSKYPGHEITRVSARRVGQMLHFNVRLEKDGARKELSIDEDGNISE